MRERTRLREVRHEASAIVDIEGQRGFLLGHAQADLPVRARRAVLDRVGGGLIGREHELISIIAFEPVVARGGIGELSGLPQLRRFRPKPDLSRLT
jgi:hypothetical protein